MQNYRAHGEIDSHKGRDDASSAPNSKELVCSVPLQIGSHRRTHGVYVRVLSFSAKQYSIEPLICGNQPLFWIDGFISPS